MTPQTAPTPWPVQVRLKKSMNTLYLTYEDGREVSFSGRHLRENSPSAEVQGHGGVRPVVHINPDVRMTGVEAVGNYAIRILFDDGHATGIYSWDYLYRLGAG